MLHCDNAGGDKAMEVEHFKPQKFPKKAHSYKNLLYCSRHCNNSKWETWPDSEEKKLGFRFINPCEEIDYGKHIYEHIKTGRLVGITEAGAYQIEKCDLNADFLVDARKQRTKIKNALKEIKIEKDMSSLSEFGIERGKSMENMEIMLKNLLDKAIPDIPPLPQEYEYLLEDFLP